MNDNSKRYAREDYVRDMYRWYWQRTVNLVNEKSKKTTALVAASTIVSMTALLLDVFSRHYRCR